MKRISLLLVVLLSILCTVTEARTLGSYGYTPLKNRTRWSPYTQSLVSGLMEYNPNASGLVYYRLKYSPYALGSSNNGLVDQELQYNPYASGLVSNRSADCWGHAGSPTMNVIHTYTPTEQNTSYYETQFFSDYAKKVNEENIETRKANIEKQKEQIEKNKQVKAEDPSEAIRQFLESNNIRFKANRYLRIDGETVSVNFDIEDANLIIKFWNSKIISELDENSKYKKDIYDNYLESWKEYYSNNIGNSKKVLNIISGSREELAEQLSFSEDLNCTDILYASAQK